MKNAKGQEIRWVLEKDMLAYLKEKWPPEKYAEFEARLKERRERLKPKPSEIPVKDSEGRIVSTCTRPLDRNGYGLSPQEADRRARLFEDKLRLLPDSLAVHQEWRNLLVASNVSGVQVHDARLVAAMRVHRVGRILTFNEKDFARYTDIEAVNPRTISAKHP